MGDEDDRNSGWIGGRGGGASGCGGDGGGESQQVEQLPVHCATASSTVQLLTARSKDAHDTPWHVAVHGGDDGDGGRVGGGGGASGTGMSGCPMGSVGGVIGGVGGTPGGPVGERYATQQAEQLLQRIQFSRRAHVIEVCVSHEPQLTASSRVNVKLSF